MGSPAPTSATCSAAALTRPAGLIEKRVTLLTRASKRFAVCPDTPLTTRPRVVPSPEFTCSCASGVTFAPTPTRPVVVTRKPSTVAPPRRMRLAALDNSAARSEATSKRPSAVLRMARTVLLVTRRRSRALVVPRKLPVGMSPKSPPLNCSALPTRPQAYWSTKAPGDTCATRPSGLATTMRSLSPMAVSGEPPAMDTNEVSSSVTKGRATRVSPSAATLK